ncbi:histamine H2 receptor-like [Asterias amurensis]|uniref:histamine H2 receptor-like n=1 Tax=Asterias amurensis TaxID=7602 RepID=UPI003AB7740D
MPIENMNSTSTYSVGLSPVLVALRSCFIAIIALLIISGNILSIAVTRRVTNLADSTKVLMTSLAVFDLLLGFLALPSTVASALDGWPFDVVGCDLVNLLITMCFPMSMFSIVSLNIERFIAVTRPYKFTVWCTRFRVILAVLFQAIISVCYSFLIVVASNEPAKFDDILQLCNFVEAPFTIRIFTLVSADIFPTISMSYIYYRLIKISRQHEQRLNQNGNNEANNNHDNKALKTFLVVTLTFAGCYTPHLTLKTLTSLGVSTPRSLSFLFFWLVISNSMFNVIIYCLFNKVFRQTAKKILLERFPCCNRSVAPIEIEL